METKPAFNTARTACNDLKPTAKNVAEVARMLRTEWKDRLVQLSGKRWKATAKSLAESILKDPENNGISIDNAVCFWFDARC